MKKEWIIVTLLFAVPSFFLSRIIWPDSQGAMPPPPSLIPFFILISAVESFLFGLGIAFILLGKSVVKKVSSNSKSLATAVYISIAWLLISWWPHDNFHRAVGMDYHGLIIIEYAFHLTLIVATLILTYNFFHPFSNTSKKI